VIKRLEESMVDGIIISLSKETENFNYINKLISDGMPVVQFNRVSENIIAPKVLFDDYKWAFFATERLIEAGYRSIYHYAAPHTLSLSKKRIKAFVDALKKHGLFDSCEQVVETGFTIEDGKEITEKLLAEGKKFDAIFSSNDRSAIGAIKVLKQHGYKIPEDFGVMGFSESSLATVVEPELSSVEQPTIKMGQVAAGLLLDLINSDDSSNLHDVVLGGKIHVRESSMRKLSV
jgi:DNA-binding LacI/PurR family transcriptional regulator